MKISAILTLALAATATTATPAFAQADTSPAVTSIVATADLDLSEAADRRVLELRIVHAAHEVCGTASDIDLMGKKAVRACRVATIAKAYSQRDALIAAAQAGQSIRVASAR